VQPWQPTLSAFVLATTSLAIVCFSSCSHPKQTRVTVPPPPTAQSASVDSSLPDSAIANDHLPNNHAPGSSTRDAGPSLAEPTIPAGTVSLASETGLASWYGPPYHARRGSNGEIYNMHAMTAAHRTLPLGTIVRVTNLKTNHSALVRITDRGPFIPGRIIDLSLAAAHKLDIYQSGVAKVRVEVMQTPAALTSGGKWAVQIGGFPHEDAATELAGHLTRRYRTAKVLRFASPAGDWWIRVRVLGDDHERAQQLAAETHTPEGAVFLVRLD
jgi:rare lipoprotein A